MRFSIRARSRVCASLFKEPEQKEWANSVRIIFFPHNVSWDDFKSDSISLNDIASLRKRASELVDKVGFDDGPGS
jgi:hypothetical protein